MTHLRIENQNSNTEIVSAAIILKLYETALSAEGSVSLKGNLLAEHARQPAYNYLTGNLPDSNTKRFPELSINVTDGLYINFADPEVERILLANNIGDGVGITMEDAAACTGALGRMFEGSTITSFDELAYFGWNKLYYNNSSSELGSFYGCTSLTSIDLNGITSHNNARKSFKNCTSLTTVKNLNLTFIPRLFFSNCSSLLNIDFSNVEYFEESACYGCTSLVSANTSNCKTFEKQVFQGCTSLTTVDLSNVTSLGSNAFFGCTALTTVTLNPNLTTIGIESFRNCTSLSSIDISNITLLGYGAFRGCTSLTTLNTSNVTDISYDVFTGCTNLLSLDMSNCNLLALTDGFSQYSSTNSPFANCTNLTTIGINTINVTSLRPQAFIGCESLCGELNFPNLTSVSTNGNLNQFKNCKKLTKISLGHVLSIAGGNIYQGHAIFKNCISLKILDLGDSITSVGDNCMTGCTSLIALVIRTTTPPSTFGSANVTLLINNGAVVYVPSSAVSTYQNDSIFGSLTIKSIENDYNESSILGTTS